MLNLNKITSLEKNDVDNFKKTVKIYNLDMIIAVGYRVNSEMAIQSRRWATKILKEYITKGFSLNDECFINAFKYDIKYFDELLDVSKQLE